MILKSLYPLAHVFVRPIWWVFSLCWTLTSLLCTSRAKKQVLLVAYNHLTARYIRHAADLLRNDPRVALHLVRAPFVDRNVPLQEIIAQVDVPYIRFWKAWAYPWDLLLSADHYPAPLLHPRIKKMFVTHGLFAGRTAEGPSYVYGARAVRSHGEPVFSRMAAANEIERQAAVHSTPALSDVVTVVGDQQADLLLERRAQYHSIRARLRISDQQTVVIIMSTWGPQSLIETVGVSLLDQARTLLRKYHFILTIHPNNFTRADGRWNNFIEQQESCGIRTIGPTESWLDYLVASDIAITDYTSLGLYFAQLVRPMILTSFQPSDFVKTAPIHEIGAISPRLDSFENLQQAIQHTLEHYPLDQLEHLAAKLLAHRGQAADRMKSELYDLLLLSRP